MSRKYKFGDTSSLYFVTYTVVHWIDVFIREEHRHILLESWEYCKKHKGLEIYAYCIMTSHVHMIIGSNNKPLADIMRDMKSFTSTQMRKAMEENPKESRKEWILWMMKRAGQKNANNKDFQFWQQDNHPIELFGREIMEQKLNYIHQNPVVAGFVQEAENYIYSSAANYAGKKGMIEVILLE
jgi:putative transposase